MVFSRARLEGRALEHALCSQGGHSIRMQQGSGSWCYVSTDQAKEIRRMMKFRTELLLQDLAKHGLSKVKADASVTVQGSSHSVDLVLWCNAQQCQVLVEVKWTRQSIAVSMAQAKQSWSWMRQACDDGRWDGHRNAVKACAVGALVVTPEVWRLELQSRGVDPCWAATYPQPRYLKPARRSGRSNWVPWRGNAAPGEEPKWPSGWERWKAKNQ